MMGWGRVGWGREIRDWWRGFLVSGELVEVDDSVDIADAALARVEHALLDALKGRVEIERAAVLEHHLELDGGGGGGGDAAANHGLHHAVPCVWAKERCGDPRVVEVRDRR